MRQYAIRMKEWAKSDCRFGILVKNYTRKVTSDVSDVSDVTDVVQTLQTLRTRCRHDIISWIRRTNDLQVTTRGSAVSDLHDFRKA